MSKKNFRKLKNGTKSNRFGKMTQDLGTREMIIISCVIFAITLIVILLMAFIKGSTGDGLSGLFMDKRGVSEETTADYENQNAAVDEADKTAFEIATDGMKSESTPDTTVLAKKEGAKEGYLNRCVFLGDSRTAAMVNYGFFNDDAVLAQIGISHAAFASNKFINNAGKEYTLKSYLGSHQAPVIYILLGVNGISDSSEEHYRNSFTALIDSVAGMAPNSNIVLVSIGPVDDNGIYKDTVRNAWIDKYNAFLLETAKEKHIFYLDIAEILKGTDGQVKPEYNGGDGLHYSGKGCEAIFRYIVEHPVPGISDDGKYVVKYIKPDPNKTKVTMDNSSGIDKDKAKDVIDITMGPGEDSTSSASSSGSSDEAASKASSLDEEEAKKKAEEEEKKKAEEEAKKKAEEEEKKKKEEEEKKKAEEEERKKKEEEERKKAEEEEEKKKEEEEKKEDESEKEEDESEDNEEGSGEEEKGSEGSEEGSGGTEEGSEEASNQSEGESGNNPEGD